MRYKPEHKARVHQKIVKDAARQVRAKGLNGAAVAAVMQEAGLTHGGFYKHFASKDALVLESLREAFREISETLTRAAEQSPAGEGWKEIVKAYLSPKHCAHPELGCPVAALGPELGRVDEAMRPHVAQNLMNYKDQMLRFMPGRRAADKERALYAIFSAMVGAIEIARLLPDPAERNRVLSSTREFLLSSF